MFFPRIACWNDSQKCPYRHIWKSKLMVGHLFVVFSPTLFLNDPMVFWAHFAMLAAPWWWKTPTGNLLKRFWQRVVKKHHPTSHLGVKTMKKRLRVSCKLTTWAPTQLSNLSFDVFWCVTMAPKSQKACPRHTNAPKSNANGFPQARKSLFHYIFGHNRPRLEVQMDMSPRPRMNCFFARVAEWIVFSRWGAFL